MSKIPRQLSTMVSFLPEMVASFPGRWRAFRNQALPIQIRLAFDRALEVIAVIWVLTEFSFQPVLPVYQWY